MTSVTPAHIVYDRANRARIIGGPLVATIAFMHLSGDSLEDIAAAYSNINEELVREALDFYASHKTEIGAFQSKFSPRPSHEVE